MIQCCVRNVGCNLYELKRENMGATPACAPSRTAAPPPSMFTMCRLVAKVIALLENEWVFVRIVGLLSLGFVCGSALWGIPTYFSPFRDPQCRCRDGSNSLPVVPAPGLVEIPRRLRHPGRPVTRPPDARALPALKLHLPFSRAAYLVLSIAAPSLLSVRVPTTTTTRAFQY